MEFPKEDLQVLINLGLSIVQGKILLTLFQSEPLSAKAISEVSKVSRPDVYKTIPKLQEMGLIEKKISRPAIYSAIPIKAAASILMEQHIKKYNELKTETENLVKKYTAKYRSYPTAPSDFVFIPPKEAIINRLRSAIDATNKSINVVTSYKRLQNAGYHFLENLQSAWERGVKGRAIIERCTKREKEELEEFWNPQYAEIRFVPERPRTVMVTYDKREIFLFTNPAAKLNESSALMSDLPSFVTMANDHFEILWITAMKSSEYYLDSTKT
jgi:sugar-specific transcriptional regulator TrmB